MEYQKKKVKLITYIDHKSDLGGNAPPPPQNLAFLSVGGNFEFLGGNFFGAILAPKMGPNF